MRTKTTLIKAVKFVNNCKFIFSFRKNIFQKNIFSALFCFTILISFKQAGSFDLTLLHENNSNSKISSSLIICSNLKIPDTALIRPFTEFAIVFQDKSKNSITA